jgi:hypothetical protein
MEHIGGGGGKRNCKIYGRRRNIEHKEARRKERMWSYYEVIRKTYLESKNFRKRILKMLIQKGVVDEYYCVRTEGTRRESVAGNIDKRRKVWKEVKKKYETGI